MLEADFCSSTRNTYLVDKMKDVFLSFPQLSWCRWWKGALVCWPGDGCACVAALSLDTWYLWQQLNVQWINIIAIEILMVLWSLIINRPEICYAVWFHQLTHQWAFQPFCHAREKTRKILGLWECSDKPAPDAQEFQNSHIMYHRSK